MMNSEKEEGAETPKIVEERLDSLYHESSDEETQKKINPRASGDMYRFLSPPNPLLDKDHNFVTEVKTAFKLTFKKLPDFQPGPLHSPKPVLDAEDEAKDYLEYQNRIDGTDPTLPPTLFNLYPEKNVKEVYRKYVNRGDWEPDPKLYAGYFIDLNKLLKNKKKIKTQYTHEEYETINVEQDVDTLKFSSNFESGNLCSAYKISNKEYDLILQNDINTKGHTQWFFFSVSNTKKDQVVKFNIVNLLKGDSLFNKGMKPVVFSTKSAAQSWKRDGTDVHYFRNKIIKEGTTDENYCTLTFKYKFAHDEDTVYFAHCYPYTYSDLNNYLKALSKHPTKKNYLTKRPLCKTLLQNDCEYLTITSHKNIENIDQRLAVVLTARQHPGEPQGSYMIQGVIDYLLSEEEDAKFLRQNCIFKIIPMMNPDGVIHGNYRTCLSGTDMNRKWKKPSKSLHPTIWYTKNLIKDLKKNKNFMFFCDFHGHSQKKNAFVYGNSSKDNNINARVYPLILSKISKFFSFEDSRFHIAKSKEATARVAIWREMECDNIFTLESSFYGYDTPQRTVSFEIKDYIEIGRDVVKGLGIYVQQLLSKIVALPGLVPTLGKVDADKVDKKNLVNELKENKTLIAIGDLSDDSGSDSDPEIDDLPEEQLIHILPNNETSVPKRRMSVKPQFVIHKPSLYTEERLKKKKQVEVKVREELPTETKEKVFETEENFETNIKDRRLTEDHTKHITPSKRVKLMPRQPGLSYTMNNFFIRTRSKGKEHFYMPPDFKPAMPGEKIPTFSRNQKRLDFVIVGSKVDKDAEKQNNITTYQLKIDPKKMDNSALLDRRKTPNPSKQQLSNNNTSSINLLLPDKEQYAIPDVKLNKVDEIDFLQPLAVIKTEPNMTESYALIHSQELDAADIPKFGGNDNNRPTTAASTILYHSMHISQERPGTSNFGPKLYEANRPTTGMSRVHPVYAQVFEQNKAKYPISMKKLRIRKEAHIPYYLPARVQTESEYPRHMSLDPKDGNQTKTDIESFINWRQRPSYASPFRVNTEFSDGNYRAKSPLVKHGMRKNSELLEESGLKAILGPHIVQSSPKRTNAMITKDVRVNDFPINIVYMKANLEKKAKAKLQQG